MKKIAILGRRTGVGLDQDANLLRAEMEANGYEVCAPDIKSLWAPFSNKNHAAVAIHLERVAKRRWLRIAKRHWLIPNQECFPRRLLGTLKDVDLVLVKSRHAYDIFSELHPQVRFIGFTSRDRVLSDVVSDSRRFIHVAGRSIAKNTELILRLWSRRPDWPELTLVQHANNAPTSTLPNVKLFSGFMPDERLQLLQNECGVHLCPSLREGWGHYIAEAASCGAVIITTDGPPMNELIDASRGVLVPVSKQEPRHLGVNYYVDEKKLEATIDSVLAMPEAEKHALGLTARAWFEQNCADFAARFQGVLTQTL